jgi:hypothetical protein
LGTFAGGGLDLDSAAGNFFVNLFVTLTVLEYELRAEPRRGPRTPLTPEQRQTIHRQLRFSEMRKGE